MARRSLRPVCCSLAAQGLAHSATAGDGPEVTSLRYRRFAAAKDHRSSRRPEPSGCCMPSAASSSPVTWLESKVVRAGWKIAGHAPIQTDKSVRVLVSSPFGPDSVMSVSSTGQFCIAKSHPGLIVKRRQYDPSITILEDSGLAPVGGGLLLNQFVAPGEHGKQPIEVALGP